MSMLKNVLKLVAEGDDDGTTPDVKGKLLQDKKARMLQLRSKVKTVARMQKMYSTLKSESELLIKLKGMSPDGKIPRGLLLEGRPAIKDALREFGRAKELDRTNERRPSPKK